MLEGEYSLDDLLDKSTFGKALEMFLWATRTSQADLAAGLDATRGTVSRWISGQSWPGDQRALEVVNFFESRGVEVVFYPAYRKRGEDDACQIN